MICGECGFDNSQGVDDCESCGSYLSPSAQVDISTPFDAHLVSDVVDQLAAHPPLLVAAEQPVWEAVATMREQRHGCVLVEEQGDVIGIFTEHDLLNKVTGAGKSPQSVAVGDVMTPDPVVLGCDDSLAVLVNKMVVGFFHHVPIVDTEGKVTGVVSARGGLNRLSELLLLPAEA